MPLSYQDETVSYMKAFNISNQFVCKVTYATSKKEVEKTHFLAIGKKYLPHKETFVIGPFYYNLSWVYLYFAGTIK